MEPDPDAVEPVEPEPVEPALPEPDVPDVPAVEPEPLVPLLDPARDELPPDPIVAFARMYDPPDDEDEDALEDDPLPAAPLAVLPSWRQPVTVTVLPLLLPVLPLVPLCDVPLCAAAPTPHPAVTAIASAAI